MRVPTLNNSQQTFSAISSRQADAAKMQSQVSSGLRVQSPGDDPVAAAQAELARSRLAHITQNKRATDLANSVLATADGALGEGTAVLQSVREGLVAAGNSAYTDADRKALALTLRSARDELFAVANTRDGAGGYVFGGQGASTGPLTEGASLAYSPASGAQRVGDTAGNGFAVTLDGRSTFMSIAQGNGVFTTQSATANTGTGWVSAGSVVDATALTGHSYQVSISGTPGALTYSVNDATSGTTLVSNAAFKAGSSIDIDGQRIAISGTPSAGDNFDVAPSGQQSIFRTLDDAIALLEAPKGKGYEEGLQRAQVNLDQGLDSMIFMRSRVGSELVTVQNAADTDDAAKTDVTRRRSDLQDLDMVSGVSQLQQAQTTLNAALQSYANISRTNLFDLLR